MRYELAEKLLGIVNDWYVNASYREQEASDAWFNGDSGNLGIFEAWVEADAKLEVLRELHEALYEAYEAF